MHLFLFNLHIKDVALTKLHCLPFLRGPKTLQAPWPKPGGGGKPPTHVEGTHSSWESQRGDGSLMRNMMRNKIKCKSSLTFHVMLFDIRSGTDPFVWEKNIRQTQETERKTRFFNYLNEQKLHLFLSELMSCSNQFWLGNMEQDHQEDQINCSSGMSEGVWNHAVVFSLYCNLDFGASPIRMKHRNCYSLLEGSFDCSRNSWKVS